MAINRSHPTAPNLLEEEVEGRLRTGLPVACRVVFMARCFPIDIRAENENDKEGWADKRHLGRVWEGFRGLGGALRRGGRNAVGGSERGCTVCVANDSQVSSL